MKKQEIQHLIDTKIAGQGSAVDVGGALPKILHEILEAAFAGANVQSNWDEDNSESPQFIQNKPSIPAPYSLPTASAEVLGGVKVGSGLTIEDGVLSASGGGGGSVILVRGTIENPYFTPNDSEAWDFTSVRNALSSGKLFIINDEGEGFFGVMQNAFDDSDTITIHFSLPNGGSCDWVLIDN